MKCMKDNRKYYNQAAKIHHTIRQLTVILPIANIYLLLCH